ncbi:MAG: chromosomal replication initiator protein DnaA [Chloroflexota bacterium]|nr:chromosomal replication initiator protein DnaA [Chloroflexota bacterium]
MVVNAQELWDSAYHQLELQLDRASFETWLRGARLVAVEGDVYVIGVRNEYARDMLQSRLYRNVRRVLSDVCGKAMELRFELNKQEAKPQRNDDLSDMPLFRMIAEQDTSKPALPLHQQIIRPERAALPEQDLNPRFTLERFIAGNENQMVYAAAQAVADMPGTAYNPFFVYGGVGLGKTHLLQAIAHRCRARNLRAIYIPSEIFINDLVDAIRQKTTAMFRDKYRTADVLLVDDIQFIAGKESSQEEFFHTFNALYTFNKQVVLASDRPPRDMQTLEARLRSRFEGGLVMDIHMPELETRTAIIQQWAHERGLALAPSSCEMIALKARTNIRELEGIFNQIVATMKLTGTMNLTSMLADDVLESYQRPRHHITLRQVLETVAFYHGLEVEDLAGPKRNGPINQARQIAMYLAREYTNASLHQIGDAFGGRKHSTVLHSCAKMIEDMERQEMLRNIVDHLRGQLTKRS